MRRINRFLYMDELDENWVDEIFGLQGKLSFQTQLLIHKWSLCNIVNAYTYMSTFVARAVHVEDGTFSWETDNRPVLNEYGNSFKHM